MISHLTKQREGVTMKKVTTSTRNERAVFFEEDEWIAVCVFLDLCASFLRVNDNVETITEDEIAHLASGHSIDEFRPDRLAMLGGFAEGALLANLDLRGELDWIWTDGAHLCVRIDENDMDEVIVTVEKVLDFIHTLFIAHAIMLEDVQSEFEGSLTIAIGESDGFDRAGA